MKRLIVLCDGTGQSSHRGESSFPSNVKTLGDCLAQTYTVPGDDDKHPQVIYYQSGVGTSSSSLQGLSEGFGLGIDDNILDAYYFLSNNYEEGDEIFLFGFSRGLHCTHCCQSVVRLGLLHMNVSWMIRRAWASAVGLPDYEIVEKLKLNSKNEFYDTRLHWGIENVFHALALDEYRLTFGPTLFYLPTDDMKPKWFKAQEQPGKKEKIRLRQCWFAGAHTDIGEHINQGRKWKKTINGHHRPQDDKYGSHIQGARDAYLVENEYPGWGCGPHAGNYAVLGGHPGPTVVIPKIDNVINALSYLNPLSYTWPWSAKGAKVASPEPVECREQSCKHPIVKWDQPGATNETIHASVFARFMEVQKARAMQRAGGVRNPLQFKWRGPAAYIKGNILKCMRSRTTIIRMD
ncbi:hypothetical protein BGX38DRAFT_1245163 [Terfezia claveryi]|nr:hypothetical protein BGX38DRAFT_1245163 [Terfezia claveryi]